MLYHPEAQPQPPKIFEHGQKVDVVAEGKKRYMAIYNGLTSDGKHALVRFITGPWPSERVSRTWIPATSLVVLQRGKPKPVRQTWLLKVVCVSRFGDKLPQWALTYTTTRKSGNTFERSTQAACGL